MSARNAYFFKGAGYLRYNIDTDLVDVGPVEISKFWTHLPKQFQSDLGAVVNWSPNLILHWEKVSRERRWVEVMERLVDIYEYPVNAAAGIVGNLRAESFVIPNCVEGAPESAPMRAPGFNNQLKTFTAEEIMNRNLSAQVGPKKPGVGLAQWTAPPARRKGLFTHPFKGSALGFRVLFNMDAQIDYLVHELRTVFAGVQAVLTNPAVTANAASDAVLLHFENPQFASAQVNTRRSNAQQALNAFRRIHP